ncbi:hypothetical protein HaLaN_24001, partial [Haematococcus lacustris]
DLARLWRWLVQRAGPQAAPSNTAIDSLLDVCLEPPEE